MMNRTTKMKQLHTVNTYTLRHLAHHLHESGKHDRLHQLLVGDNFWMRAKFSRFSDDTLYTDDIALALQLYADPLPDEEALTRLLELWTARLVVRQRNQAISDDNIRLLAWLERVDEALQFAKLRPNAQEAFKSVQAIYEIQKKKGHFANKLLDEMVRHAEQIGANDVRAEAFADIAHEFLKQEQFDQFRKLVPYVTNGDWYYNIQTAFTYAQFKQGEVETAHSNLLQLEPQFQQITNDVNRSATLVTLALVWHELGQLERAKQIFQQAYQDIQKHGDPQTMVFALSILGNGLFEVNEINRATEVYQEANQLIDEINIKGMRDYTRMLLVDELIKVGFYEPQPLIIQSIEEKALRLATDCTMTTALAKLDKTEQAHRLIDKVQTEWLDLDADSQQFLSGKLAYVFANLHDWSTAQALVSKLTTTNQRRTTLLHLAMLAAESGERQLAQTFYDQSNAIPPSIEMTAQSVHALCALVLMFYQCEYISLAHILLDRAVAITQQLARGTRRSDALRKLVITMFFVSGQALVWQLAEEMPQDEDAILLTLAQQLDLEGQLTLLPELYESKRSKQGSFAAEILHLWSVALAKQSEVAQAKTLVNSLIEMNRQLMSILLSATQTADEPVGTDLLFTHWLCLEAKSCCEIAVAQFNDGDPIGAEEEFQNLELRIFEIEDDYLKIAPTAILALTRYQIGQHDEATRLINCAELWAKSLQNRERRERAFLDIMQYFLDTTEIDRAYSLLDAMDRMGNQWQQSLCMVAIKLAESEDTVNAINLTTQIKEPKLYSDTCQWIANVLWKRQHFFEAVALYSSVSLEHFIQQITTLLYTNAQQYQGSEPLQSIQILSRILQVAGWVDENWCKIYQYLHQETS